MTVQQLEDLRDQEYSLLNMFRAMQHSKKKLIEAFDLIDVGYDDEKDELCFLTECGEDDFGVKVEVKHHIDEMLEADWAEVEEESNDIPRPSLLKQYLNGSGIKIKKDKEYSAYYT